MEETAAIIAAAGSGKRIGGTVPKQFVPVAGRPLLAYTISVFDQLDEIDDIIVLVPRGWEEFCQVEIIEKYGVRKVTQVLSGGATRQDSVFWGLERLPGSAEIVVVHDGARPLVAPESIRQSIEAARAFGAAVVAVPVTATIKQVGAGIVERTVDRSSLWMAQTPQVFRKALLVRAHEQARTDGVLGTDESALVERIGVRVRIVPGSAENLKVTTPEDLALAEYYLARRT